MSATLNHQQKQAAEHLTGPLLILAGAGSGKTRIVAHRILHLIESGVSPGEILAVTFTNKAAKEMQERIYSLLKGRCSEVYPTISTFHSLGAKILRESIDLLGYGTNFTIYDAEDSHELLKTCLASLGIKKERAEVKSIRSMISHIKNELLPESEITKEEGLAQIYHLYQRHLKEANALDFDDLLYLTAMLLKNHPERLAFYQTQWPFLLIDEYQDTNHAQHMIAKLIVGTKQNLFVVGDPDQSIYSWRGANISHILQFETHYPGAKVIRLEQNYRSSGNILEAANALIQNNVSRFKKNLWSNKGAGEKITLFVGENERDEALFVSEEIEKLSCQSALREMAILYRTNFQSRTFEDALLRAKIPYVIIGGISFYQRKEIKDILAFLRMCEGDHDWISFTRTINLPKRGIGEATLEKIRDLHTGSLLEFCLSPNGVKLSEKQRNSLKQYAHIIYALREIKGENDLQKLVTKTIDLTNYLQILQEDQETFKDRKENLEELIAKAAEGESLQTFLEELSLKSSADDADDPSQDRINLMTLHHAKGLEFTTAFLVGMEEDLFPHVNSKENYDALEEERRLCYVGMTRAKERLYLSAAETRFIWGGYRRMRPSRFLREIPRQYIIRVQ